MSAPQAIASPCIRHCTLDDKDQCVGCFRQLDEICAWSGLDEQAKREVLQRCEQRRQQAPTWKFSKLNSRL
ncbi:MULTISPECIES: DUF1289 domain-containing protein [unclassified Agarivorans]|uniref:DUF1289 domain-containing protein n=1 Tax=unclassified Agarivorans TaxID=2636026 RepID=UPI003D7DF43D